MENEFEKIFLSCLGSGEILQWELDNDVNLVTYNEQKNHGIFSMVGMLFVFIPKKTKEEMFKDITSETIMDILRRERQDLYSILSKHPEGRKWVKKQIENFKKRFL